MCHRVRKVADYYRVSVEVPGVAVAGYDTKMALWYVILDALLFMGLSLVEGG